MAVRPSIDAIAEVRVQTNLYSAETTRTAGGVINVLTKSGTNEIHGTVYEFLRNDKVDSRDFFALQNPEYRQNQFGGSVGGPIKKDRTFFFADIEVLRLIQGQTFTTTVPTNYERANIGDFSDNNNGPVVPASRISPIGLKYFNLFPAPNKPGTVANYVASPSRTQYSKTFDVRLDHHLTANDSLFGRYSYNTTDTYTPSDLPAVNSILPSGNIFGGQGTAHQVPQNVQLNYVHIFSPKLLLEAKAGFTRFVNNSFSLNYGHNYSEQFGMPGINVSDVTSGLAPMYLIGYAALGDQLYLPATRTLNTFQYSGSVSYSAGSHSIKTGVSLIRRQINNFGAGYPLGWWIFAPLTIPGISTSNSAANLLMGTALQTQRELPYYGTRGSRFWEPGVYIQDDWRLTRWLTLNLGLRYDVFPPFTEVHNWISNFDPVNAKVLVASSSDKTAGMKTDWGNLAPRFGFGASLPHSLVLRGGFGLSFFPANQGYPDLLTTPFDYTYGPVSIRLLSAGFPALTLPDASNPSGTLSGRALDFKSAYLEQYNLTIQKQVGANVFSVGYVGALGRELSYGGDFDLPAPSPLANPASRLRYASVLPNVSSISYAFNGGNSSYQALQTTFQRQLSKGLGINANYTWGHAIDDVQNGSAPNSGYGLSPFNLKATERANSDLDVRHRFTISAVYQVPFGSSLTGPAALALKGWQLNMIATWQTSLPFTILNQSNPQTNQGAAVTTDRPNRIASGTLPNPTLAEWFDTSAFAVQPFGTLGNEARNVLFGPHAKRVDLSLFKEFPIRERFRAQLRAECYKISNTPSFGMPGSFIGAGGFGSVTSTNPQVGPRVFQVALKALF